MHSEGCEALFVKKRQIEILRFARNDDLSNVILNPSAVLRINSVKDLMLKGST
jgi:hypothetical protein